MSIAEAAQTVSFDNALQHAAARALAKYPAEERRIKRGLAIALAGGVVLLDDGTALVQSQSDPSYRFRVNGHCACADYPKAPEGRCKHRFSKALYNAACKLMLATQEPQYPRYYSTYYRPDGEAVQGIASWSDHGWLFVSEDGSTYEYVSSNALVRGGRCDLADAQAAQDGDYWKRMALPSYVEWRAAR